jgi:hypothetical protein
MLHHLFVLGRAMEALSLKDKEQLRGTMFGEIVGV